MDRNQLIEILKKHVRVVDVVPTPILTQRDGQFTVEREDLAFKFGGFESVADSILALLPLGDPPVGEGESGYSQEEIEKAEKEKADEIYDIIYQPLDILMDESEILKQVTTALAKREVTALVEANRVRNILHRERKEAAKSLATKDAEIQDRVNEVHSKYIKLQWEVSEAVCGPDVEGYDHEEVLEEIAKLKATNAEFLAIKSKYEYDRHRIEQYKTIKDRLEKELSRLKEENEKLREEVTEYRKYVQIMGLMKSMFEFVEATHKAQSPMMTKFVLRIEDSDTKDIPVVSIWAGVGAANPLDRIRELKEENASLKAQLPQAQQPQQWVSSDERIPEAREYVIAKPRLFGRLREVSWEIGADQNAAWFKKNFSQWIPKSALPTPQPAKEDGQANG